MKTVLSFLAFAEGALENFWQKCAKVYEERRTSKGKRQSRSDEVNRSRRQKFSVPEAKKQKTYKRKQL